MLGAGALPAAPEWSLTYAYSGGARVAKSATDSAGVERHTLEIFDTLRLDRDEYVVADGDYQRSSANTHVYLAGGIGHVFDDGGTLPAPASTKPTRLFLNIGDHLGSASVTIDHTTSEVVERATFTSHGAIESDYRPDRWGANRERYKFTGKEEDIEVGATYFGARYYNAHLGRFMSPDPLSIHGLGGDLNPYAYVGGRVMSSVDPLGLCSEPSSEGGSAGGCPSPEQGPASQPPPDTVYVHGEPRIFGDPFSPFPGDPPPFADGGAPMISLDEVSRLEAEALATRTIGRYEAIKQRQVVAMVQALPGIGPVMIGAEAANPHASTGSRVSSGALAVAGVIPFVGGVAGELRAAEAGGASVLAAEATPNIVYRGLAAGEDATAGLVARAPGATNTPLSHVAGKIQSQWISTTKDLAVATEKYGANGVVAIDLSKVGTSVVDLSAGIPGARAGTRLWNYAVRDSEVLIQGSVPPEAILWLR